MARARSGRTRANAKRPTTRPASSSAQKLAERMRQSAEALPPGERQRQQRCQGAAVAGRSIDRRRAPGRAGRARARSDRRSPRRRQPVGRMPIRGGCPISSPSTQELRGKVDELNRNIDELQRESDQAGAKKAQPAQAAESGQTRPRPRSRGSKVRDRRAGTGQSRRRARAPGRGSAKRARWVQRPAGRQRRAAATAALQQLQREVNEQMRDAERLADEMRRENPACRRRRQRRLVAQLLGAGHRGLQAGFRALGVAQAESARRARTRRDRRCPTSCARARTRNASTPAATTR